MNAKRYISIRMRRLLPEILDIDQTAELEEFERRFWPFYRRVHDLMMIQCHNARQSGRNGVGDIVDTGLNFYLLGGRDANF